MVSEKISLIENTVSKDTLREYSKIYKLHKYWSRKPWAPISNCIMKYSNEGEIVLDMFMGSGVTALESVFLNRNFVGFDLNPMSIMITKGTLNSDFKLEQFENDLIRLSKFIEPLARKVYSINQKCTFCGSNLITDHINLGPKFRGSEEGHFFCIKCGKSKTRVVRTLSQDERKRLDKRYKITKWYPQDPFPSKFYKDRFSYKGIKIVSDMYTKRNLYILSELLEKLKNLRLYHKDLFLLAFSNTVLHSSKLKSENVRPLGVNNYWVPDDYLEENVWLRFLERLELVKNSKIILNERIKTIKKLGDAKVYQKSCLKTGLGSESVDYIITDPPYGDAIQYSELSFIWNSWMGEKFKTEEEVIINPVQNKKISDFLDLLEGSIIEAKRVLKKGKKYTLCFHNKDFGIWKGVLDIFKRNDFLLEDIEIVDVNGNPFNSNWSKFSPKSDLYLTFSKGKFNYTHDKLFDLDTLIKNILSKNPSGEISQIYDSLCVNLIQEIYYNKYQIDISKLSIKKLGTIVNNIINGN